MFTIIIWFCTFLLKILWFWITATIIAVLRPIFSLHRSPKFCMWQTLDQVNLIWRNFWLDIRLPRGKCTAGHKYRIRCRRGEEICHIMTLGKTSTTKQWKTRQMDILAALYVFNSLRGRWLTGLSTMSNTQSIMSKQQLRWDLPADPFKPSNPNVDLSFSSQK